MNDDIIEQHARFTRATQEDEDNTDDLDVEGLRVVADVILAKTIGMQGISFALTTTNILF